MSWLSSLGHDIDRGVRQNIPGGWSTLVAPGVGLTGAAMGIGKKQPGMPDLQAPPSSGVMPPQMRMQQTYGSPYQQLMNYLYPPQRMAPMPPGMGLPSQTPGMLANLQGVLGGPAFRPGIGNIGNNLHALFGPHQLMGGPQVPRGIMGGGGRFNYY